MISTAKQQLLEVQDQKYLIVDDNPIDFGENWELIYGRIHLIIKAEYSRGLHRANLYETNWLK